MDEDASYLKVFIDKPRWIYGHIFKGIEILENCIGQLEGTLEGRVPLSIIRICEWN